MRSGRPPRDAGFTYLGLLLAVAVAGTALAAAGSLWSTQAKRDKEEELLFAGQQIRDAIGRYWEKVPAGQPHAFPRTLDDLLDDKRWPVKRRHLRKLFAEPMNSTGEWGVIAAPGGGVMGVYSLSTGVPLKRAHFALADAKFSEAQHYGDWRFVYTPGAAASAPN